MSDGNGPGTGAANADSRRRRADPARPIRQPDRPFNPAGQPERQYQRRRPEPAAQAVHVAAGRTAGRTHHHTGRHRQPELPEHQPGGRHGRTLQLPGQSGQSAYVAPVLRTHRLRTYHVPNAHVELLLPPERLQVHQQQHPVYQPDLLQGRQQTER